MLVQATRTITQFAPFMDHVACVRLLIEKGARLDARCVIGNTAIFCATGLMNTPLSLKVAKILLDAGASTKIQNRFGYNALMAPVMAGSQEAVQLLVQYGCDPKQSDYEGAVPWEVAQTRPSIVHALANAEAGNQRTQAAAIEVVRACAHCHVLEKESGSALKFCMGCLAVGYCSTACQTAAWKTGGHKAECKKAQVVSVALVSTDMYAFVAPMNPALAAQMKAAGAKKQRVRTVKLQMTSEREPMLVYDKERSFSKLILATEQPAFGGDCEADSGEEGVGREGVF
ncbi:Ankyrin repeat domain-containing protein 39 [Podochytrium sp. JEL0797]|nr:Ankyrin repeat domain-containing protein 39 [Podochytrium sp. JEL0797]